MDYYCEVCDKFVNFQTKYKHSKSNIDKEFDKCNNVELIVKNRNIDNVDEIFCAYIVQHNREYDYYLIKCDFKLVLNDNQFGTWTKSNLFDNKTMISWKAYLEKLIDNFKSKGYNFDFNEEKIL